MLNSDYRARFEIIARMADKDIALDEAALVIASETQENLDVAAFVRRLDALAKKFETSTDRNTEFGISVASLIDFIHESEGFRGNDRDNFDPNDCYLNRVIETRQGTAISLALVHITLGQRLNIPVRGINFPGHFLIRYGGEPHLVIDPFSGRFLSEPDCATMLKQIAGPKAVLQQHYFDLASNKDILVRILENLKNIFWRRKSWDESKLCIERQQLLRPQDEGFSVQLGAVYEMQGNRHLAQHTYTVAVQEGKDEHWKNMASKRLLAMHGSNPIVH